MGLFDKFVGFWRNRGQSAQPSIGHSAKANTERPELGSPLDPKLILILGGVAEDRRSLQNQLSVAHHGQLTSFEVMAQASDVMSAYLKGERIPDAALLIVDATRGVGEDISQLMPLLGLLDIGTISVCVSHMADAGYEEEQFQLITEEVTALAGTYGISVIAYIPMHTVSAFDLAAVPSPLDWYEGPSLIDSLALLPPRSLLPEAPLRVRVTASRIEEGKRVLSGQLLSGNARSGDGALLSPSNRQARIQSVDTLTAAEMTSDSSDEDISIGLADDGFAEAGQILSHKIHPPIETDVFRVRLINLGASEITEGQSLSLTILGAETEAIVQKVEHVVDLREGPLFGEHVVSQNQVAEVVLRTRGIIALDAYGTFEGSGYLTVHNEAGLIEAAGVISMAGYADQRSLITPRSSNITLVKQSVSADERAHRNSHRGGVLWFTGLSGAGKSTLAVGLEQELFKQGFHTALLDGDNVRHGLNANLGFSPEDRAENIRRVGEVAALFQQSGILVMASFISPYRSDRERARDAAADGFHEIYIKADVDTCIERDPKGLYQRALAGEIVDFTGISAPYEVPEQADLVVDTGKLTVEQSIALLVDYVNTHFKV